MEYDPDKIFEILYVQNWKMAATKQHSDMGRRLYQNTVHMRHLQMTGDIYKWWMTSINNEWHLYKYRATFINNARYL